MIVQSVQLAKWRKLKAANIKLLDTTVKSGDPIFAPSWDIVLAVKRGEITEEQYTERYIELMRKSYFANREKWHSVMKDEEEVAIACYCTPGKFCHRHLLIDIFKKLCEKHNIPFEYRGEFI